MTSELDMNQRRRGILVLAFLNLSRAVPENQYLSAVLLFSCFLLVSLKKRTRKHRRTVRQAAAGSEVSRVIDS